MKNPCFVWSALAAAAVFMVQPSVQAQKAGTQSPQRFAATITREIHLQYLLYLPRDYQEDAAQRWPLLLFLHGAGERGTDLNKVAVHGPPKLIGQGANFPFIVVSPQCPTDERWRAEELIRLLDHVCVQYAVDTNRIYLTGLSMGGFGSWSLAALYPERFAAVAPICGGGEVIDVLLASPKRREAFKTLGIWAFHGAKDPVVPLAESERMVAAFKRAGCQEVKLTVYPEAQHDSWTETYANPKLYEWFLKHRR